MNKDKLRHVGELYDLSPEDIDSLRELIRLEDEGSAESYQRFFRLGTMLDMAGKGGAIFSALANYRARTKPGAAA